MLLSNKGVEWNFLATALTSPGLSPESLSSNVDKLTFQSAAKNLTHDLDLLSLNLLAYNQQNKPSSQGNLLKVTLDMTNFILRLSLPQMISMSWKDHFRSVTFDSF